MRIIVSSSQHCYEHQFQTLSCVQYTSVHDLLSGEIRFTHTNTGMRSYSCFKKYAYATRASRYRYSIEKRGLTRHC